MLLDVLATVMRETSEVYRTDLARASAAFDARAGAVCRDLAARYSSGASQAACLLSLVARIVAEDAAPDAPLPDASPPAGVTEDLAADPMFRMLDRCTRAFPAFIEGSVTGVDVIFPRGDRGLWSEVQGQSLHMRGYGRAAGAAAHALSPAGGRVLELGAGTGAATAELLARDGGRMRAGYVISDISPTLLRDARARFGDGPEYVVHDFCAPPDQQALAGRRFDVVFGANALHCAADVLASLRHTAELLAPGGFLVLAEGARPASGRVWRPELIFAVLPGWYQVPTDPRLRPEVGFLTGDAWRCVVAEVGLTMTAMLPLRSGPDDVIGHLIVARKAAA